MDKKEALYVAIGAIAIVSLEMEGKNYDIQINDNMTVPINELYVPCVNTLLDLIKN